MDPRRLVVGRAGQQLANAQRAAYRRPPVQTYTDACEAPHEMWKGAIPTRRSVVERDGTKWMQLQKTYNHPPETSPARLAFSDVNSMYCMPNDELVAHFAEGTPGRTHQLFPPAHPRGFLYRKQSHLLNSYVDKVAHYKHKTDALSALSGGRPGLVFDGPTGTGKSALVMQAVHYARSRGIFTLFVPNARDWTHGEWAWPSTILPGFWDTPDAGRNLLSYLGRSERRTMSTWKLRVTPVLPCEAQEEPPTTLLELCEWASRAVAPASIDRQSVAVKYLMDELLAEEERPMVIAIDGINLFSHESHFRFPHPSFLRSSTDLNSTDVDLMVQELPRIPASRFTFVRALNKMMLEPARNRFFITATSRDMKPFDGGVSGFPNVLNDRHANSLDEYQPFDPECDTVLYPMEVDNFDEYEYRAFVRFLINSGELAGLGWGPLWHHSPDFERKLYKIEFLSRRNPQLVIEHYHQEITWRSEYQRIRQKQQETMNAAIRDSNHASARAPKA